MDNNKPSWTNGTIKLGGKLSFDQMKLLEGILQNASLEAGSRGDGTRVTDISNLGVVLGVDGDADASCPDLEVVE